jgi:hypothetical protein
LRVRSFISISGALCVLSLAPSVQAQSAGSVERGKYLMQGVVACGNCHFQRGPRGEPLLDKGLSGGMVFDEPAFKAPAGGRQRGAEVEVQHCAAARLRAAGEGGEDAVAP